MTEVIITFNKQPRKAKGDPGEENGMGTNDYGHL